MSRFWITASKTADFILESLGRMYGGEIFVPKIPSMTVKDFIKTCAPDCEIKIIGIRPGEKIHEVLLTPEEARHSLEFDDKYIIFPENEELLKMDKYHVGKKISNDFIYISNVNERWINENELRAMLDL